MLADSVERGVLLTGFGLNFYRFGNVKTSIVAVTLGMCIVWREKGFLYSKT